MGGQAHLPPDQGAAKGVNMPHVCDSQMMVAPDSTCQPALFHPGGGPPRQYEEPAAGDQI